MKPSCVFQFNKYLANTHCRGGRIFVLPYPENSPSGGYEESIGLRIPQSIHAELGAPEVAMGHRNGVVLRAPVPETAVHEHGQALASEDQIRLAANVPNWSHIDGIPKTQSMDRRSQRQFGFGVPTAASLHRPPSRWRGGPGLGLMYAQARSANGVLSGRQMIHQHPADPVTKAQVPMRSKAARSCTRSAI